MRDARVRADYQTRVGYQRGDVQDTGSAGQDRTVRQPGKLGEGARPVALRRNPVTTTSYPALVHVTARELPVGTVKINPVFGGAPASGAPASGAAVATT